MLLPIKYFSQMRLVPFDHWKAWQCVKLLRFSSGACLTTHIVGKPVHQQAKTSKVLGLPYCAEWVCVSQVRSVQTQSDKKTHLVESHHKPDSQLTFAEKGLLF